MISVASLTPPAVKTRARRPRSSAPAIAKGLPALVGDRDRVLELDEAATGIRDRRSIEMTMPDSSGRSGS